MSWIDKIIGIDNKDFDKISLEIFEYQYHNVSIYKAYCDLRKKNPSTVQTITDIPFLPIHFFKTHTILDQNKSCKFVFESSTTTGQTPSKHFVADEELYKASFIHTFEKRYGKTENFAILGLLPSYLERGNSSLVYMVESLIKKSGNELNGFFLNDFEKLSSVLKTLEDAKTATILFGVSYALLDFAAKHPMPLRHTEIIETGGMKGKRKEMTRTEIHYQLKEAFELKNIGSEYGMTELLSQAYLNSNNCFESPAWMKILIRDTYSPTEYEDNLKIGGINIIDLANLHSCAFIETSDIGKLSGDASFEVLGRMGYADIRGCNLMYEG